MKPVVSIVGRPNAGKSTLFNRLTGSRDALTADAPGLTRDILTGEGRIGDIPYLLLDTAGVSGGRLDDATTAAAINKSLQAIEDAERLLWVVDARAGISADDIYIAERLRRRRRVVTVAMNKAEDLDTTTLAAECQRLGYSELCAVSALHGHGLEDLMKATLNGLEAATVEARDQDSPMRVAIVGRQNAGKSTLVNCLLDEDRVLAGPAPGTTRDSVRVELRRGRNWQLIDTAGLRRRSKVKQQVEALSMAKSLQTIAEADIVLLLLDATEGVTSQDMQLLEMVLRHGKRYIVAMNKSDLLPARTRKRTRADFAHKLRYVPDIRIYMLSALQRTYIRPLLQALQRVALGCSKTIPTGHLNRILQQAVEQHPPPLRHGRRPRLLYAHLASMTPLCIVVHGRQVEFLRDSWRRYLARQFADALRLEGTPVQLVLKTQHNPYIE